MALAATAVIGLGACGSSGGSDGTKADGTTTSAARRTTTTAAPTTTASTTTTTAVPTVALGDPFYADDFRDASKGWPTGDSATRTLTLHSDYATPLYTVTVKGKDAGVAVHPEFRGITQQQLRDYAITAQIQSTLQVGHDDTFGVTCRDLRDDRYLLAMQLPSSTNDLAHWAIYKVTGSTNTDLGHGTFETQGSSWTITGACTGGHDGKPAVLDLLVNGDAVGHATDASDPLEEGYGGVYLDSVEGNTTVNVLSFSASTVSVG